MASPLQRPAPSFSDVDFRLLADLVRRHCGLHFGPESRFLLERRVAKRLRELELPSLPAYHGLLRRAGDGELAQLVDELVTNETYFFRERRQLQALIGEILPELRRSRPSSPASIWSAGCSSGEEPYSIVMLAREAGFAPGLDLRVVASDISQRMLRKARQGLYREASFRETDPALRRKYFSEKDGAWQIAESVRAGVDFLHLNLLDSSRLALLAGVDVILCRNVLIYFDLETRKRVVASFYERLRAGGHLLLGHSESLVNLSSAFELCHLSSDLVYRRPPLGAAHPRPRALSEVGA
jgi:chemotaxis protein methyltransferase CheR